MPTKDLLEQISKKGDSGLLTNSNVMVEVKRETYNPVSRIAFRLQDSGFWPDFSMEHYENDSGSLPEDYGSCLVSQPKWGTRLIVTGYDPNTFQPEYDRVESSWPWWNEDIFDQMELFPVKPSTYTYGSRKLKDMYGSIAYDSNTLDRDCPDSKTDTWMDYNESDTSNWTDGMGIEVRREIVEKQLNRIQRNEAYTPDRNDEVFYDGWTGWSEWARNPQQNTCFAKMLFLFFQDQMIKDLRTQFADPEHSPPPHYETHPSDGGNAMIRPDGPSRQPYPTLLLYLYRQLSYLSNLKTSEALEFLYTRVPEIFYPYRNAFIVEVGAKNSCGKKYHKKADKQKRIDNRDLQAVVGLTYNFNSPEGDKWTSIGLDTKYTIFPTDLPDFGYKEYSIYGFKKGGGLSVYNDGGPDQTQPGNEWWAAQFKKRLPDRFFTTQQIVDWIGPELFADLREHLLKYEEIYSDKDNYSVPWVTNIITGDIYTHRVDPTEALEWWEDMIEVSEAGGSTDFEAAAAAAEALRMEMEGVENLDFSLCSLEPPLIPPSSKCGFCVPDKNAPVPDWTKRTDSEPFLNKKTCEYSIATLTLYESPRSDLGANILPQLMADAIKPGVKKLLQFYNKDTSSEVVDIVSLEAIAKDYFVPTRPHLKMKILVTLSADILDRLPPKPETPPDDANEDSTDDTEAPLTPNENLTVTLKGSDIRPFFKKIQAALFYKWGIDYQTAVFTGDLKYPGVNFILLASGMGVYRTKLLSFLREKNFKINPARKNLAKLDKVILKFSSNYELVAVQAKKMGCPIEDITEGIEEFRQEDFINDRTLSALVSSLPNIITDLTSRAGLGWEPFVEKYLIPSVIPIERDAFAKSQSKLSGDCNIGKVLGNIAKPIISIGENAVGEILSFPELFVNELGSQVCYTIEKHKMNDRQLQDASTMLKRQKDQWQRQLNAADSVFADLPKILDERVSNLDEFFSELLDKLGVCGMGAVLSGAADCVGAGLGLEISAASALKALINSSTEKQMQGLFFAMNPGLQKLITNSVKELTAIPLPWEAGYNPGSYNGAGVTYGIDYAQKRKKTLAKIGIEETEIGKEYDRASELVFPDDCPVMQGGSIVAVGNAIKYDGYVWEDENTLYYYKNQKSTKVNLKKIPPDHEIFKCRPMRLVFNVPAGEGE